MLQLKTLVDNKSPVQSDTVPRKLDFDVCVLHYSMYSIIEFRFCERTYQRRGAQADGPGRNHGQHPRWPVATLRWQQQARWWLLSVLEKSLGGQERQRSTARPV